MFIFLILEQGHLPALIAEQHVLNAKMQNTVQNPVSNNVMCSAHELHLSCHPGSSGSNPDDATFLCGLESESLTNTTNVQKLHTHPQSEHWKLWFCWKMKLNLKFKFFCRLGWDFVPGASSIWLYPSHAWLDATTTMFHSEDSPAVYSGVRFPQIVFPSQELCPGSALIGSW